MQPAKKEAANRVLTHLGTNASQVINELFDYIISNKTLPWTETQSGQSDVSESRLLDALAWVDSLQVQLSPEFADLSLKEAKKIRLLHNNDPATKD